MRPRSRNIHAPRRAINAGRMQRRRGRGRRGRGGRRRGAGMHYIEIIPISIELGTSQDLTVALLNNRPKACAYRVQTVSFSGTTCFVPAGSTADKLNIIGFYAPSCVQIDMYADFGGTTANADVVEIVSTTGPIVMGMNPRTIRIHQPRTSSWIAQDAATTTKFARIAAACIGKPAGEAKMKGYLRGVLRVMVKFGTEQLNPACQLQDFIDSTIIVNNDEYEPVAVDSPSALVEGFSVL